MYWLKDLLLVGIERPNKTELHIFRYVSLPPASHWLIHLYMGQYLRFYSDPQWYSQKKFFWMEKIGVCCDFSLKNPQKFKTRIFFNSDDFLNDPLGYTPTIVFSMTRVYPRNQHMIDPCLIESQNIRFQTQNPDKQSK